MPMLSLLLSLAFQDQVIGWNCDAERVVDGRVYRLVRSVEGAQRSPPTFRITWLSAPPENAPFVEWIDAYGMPPAAPRTINFRVPVTAWTRTPSLRIVLPDGTARLLADNPSNGWGVSISSAPYHVYFYSLSRELNRDLWAARSFRVSVEDPRGRALGSRDISFPDPDEAARLAAALGPEVAAKLGEPANPAHRCSSYGPEVYEDPVFPRSQRIGQPGSRRKSR